METNGCETSENETDVSDPQISNNVSVSELDEETATKLRGDTIGDTLYSQTFVLRTLIKFSDLKWNEEMEEDLCFLWDMTVEKDVCKYLFEISFPSLACEALEKYTEHRLIEILIGILANILCADCEKNITEDQINTVLRELDTDDHLILIQVVRFIIAVTHIFNEVSFISNDILDKLIFILYNSTNSELLIKTLEAVSKITDNFKLEKDLVDTEIMKSSLSAYKRAVGELDEFGLDTKDKRTSCRYMFEIVNNICAYVSTYDNNNLLQECKHFSNILLNEIGNILYCFTREENLLPITDEFIFYISVVKFVLETLNTNYLTNIFLPLSKILYLVYDFKDDLLELIDTIVELECLLFAKSSPKLLCKDLKTLSKNNVKTILDIVKENQHRFDMDLNLQYLSDKFR